MCRSKSSWPQSWCTMPSRHLSCIRCRCVCFFQVFLMFVFPASNLRQSFKHLSNFQVQEAQQPADDSLSIEVANFLFPSGFTCVSDSIRQSSDDSNKVVQLRIIWNIWTLQKRREDTESDYQILILAIGFRSCQYHQLPGTTICRIYIYIIFSW